MVSSKNGYKFFMGFLLGLSLVCVGCDKLSFLGDYFPSMKKKGSVEPVKVEASMPQSSQEAAAGKDVLAKVDNWTLTVQEFNDKVATLKTAMGEFDDKDPKNNPNLSHCTCGICYNIPHKPYMYGCCDKICCKECVEKSFKSSKKCPFCRKITKDNVAKESKYCKNIINELRIF